MINTRDKLPVSHPILLIFTICALLLCSLPRCCGQSFIEGYYDARAKSYIPADPSCWVGTFINHRAYLYKDGYVGLMDTSGHIIIPPQYDKLFPFDSGGIANMTLNGKYGLIDIQGNVIATPFATRPLGPFYDGYAIYTATAYTSYGVIDRKGRRVTSADYWHVQYVGEGQFLFRKQDTLGLITPATGDVVLLEMTTHVGPLRESQRGEYELEHNGRTVPFIEFNAGLALVCVGNAESYTFGCIDRKGRMVIPAKYDWIEPFHDGLAMAQLKGKWGIINTKGKLVVPALYDSISLVESDLFIVSQHGKFGLVTAKNRIAVPFDYTFLAPADTSPFEQTMHAGYVPTVVAYSSMIFDEDRLVASKGKGYGVITRENTTVIPFIYDSIHAAGNNRFIVSNGARYGVVNDRNETVISLDYDRVVPIADDRFTVWKNDKVGVVSSDNVVLIQPKYSAIYPLFDDLLAVHNGTGYDVIDINEQGILPSSPFSYHGVVTVDSSLGIACSGYSIPLNTGVPRYRYCGTYFYFDKKGRIDTINYHFSFLHEGLYDWFTPEQTLSHGPAYFSPRMAARMYRSSEGVQPSSESSTTQAYLEKQGFRITSTPDSSAAEKLPTPDSAQTYRPISRFMLCEIDGERPAADKYGVIDINGDTIVPFVYDEISLPAYGNESGTPNNVFIARRDRKMGVVNIRNEIVVPFEYTHIQISSGIILFAAGTHRDDHRQCVVDLNGNVLIPFLDTTSAMNRIIMLGGAGELRVKEWERHNPWGKEMEYVIDRAGKRIEDK